MGFADGSDDDGPVGQPFPYAVIHPSIHPSIPPSIHPSIPHTACAVSALCQDSILRFFFPHHFDDEKTEAGRAETCPGTPRSRELSQNSGFLNSCWKSGYLCTPALCPGLRCAVVWAKGSVPFSASRGTEVETLWAVWTGPQVLAADQWHVCAG